MSKLKVSAQKGGVLALVLIVLTIGALLIPSLLAHVSTNLQATRVVEEGLKEQYSADAGAEHAIWRLENDPEFAASLLITPTRSYTITINNMTTWVTVTQP